MHTASEILKKIIKIFEKSNRNWKKLTDKLIPLQWQYVAYCRTNASFAGRNANIEAHSNRFFLISTSRFDDLNTNADLHYYW